MLSSVLKCKRAIIEIGSALLHLVNRGIARGSCHWVSVEGQI